MRWDVMGVSIYRILGYSYLLINANSLLDVRFRKVARVGAAFSARSDKTEGRKGQFHDKKFTISRIATNVRFGDHLRSAGLCLKSNEDNHARSP